MKRKSLSPGKKSSLLPEIHRRLLDRYGPQKCFLEHETPFQLLVATILSAQCPDQMVNRVTKDLFREYPAVKDFAAMTCPELEEKIHACGYYRAKAKNILACAEMIMEKFSGEVPSTMEELSLLPGVGRKTANVVLADCFGVPGLPVDTHVGRICRHLGVTRHLDPEKIEAELCRGLPPECWGEFSHLVIVHGRNQCPARKPHCEGCILLDLCKTGQKSGKEAKK